MRISRIRLSDDYSATGIRKELTALLSQVNQPLGQDCAIQRRTVQELATPLAPRHHKATKPFMHEPIDFPESHSGIAKAEVCAPPFEVETHAADHFLDWRLHASGSHLPQVFSQSLQALSGRDNIEIGPLPPKASLIAKSKAQKVQTLPSASQVNDACFVPIQLQPETLQLSLYEFLDRRPHVARKNHESSSAGEFHPHVLSDPYVRLSPHPAPYKRIDESGDLVQRLVVPS